MQESYIFLANGFEEVEALATVDVLRRAEMNVKTVSINTVAEVTGAHGVKVTADTVINNVELPETDSWLICPGGMPGATNLAACGKLSEMLRNHNAAGGKIAAICASPALVLSPLGIIDGRKATCYPGMESLATTEAEMTGERVVRDGNVITGNGPASTFAFALAIVEASKGAEAAGAVAQGMLYKY